MRPRNQRFRGRFQIGGGLVPLRDRGPEALLEGAAGAASSSELRFDASPRSRVAHFSGGVPDELVDGGVSHTRERVRVVLITPVHGVIGKGHDAVDRPVHGGHRTREHGATGADCVPAFGAESPAERTREGRRGAPAHARLKRSATELLDDVHAPVDVAQMVLVRRFGGRAGRNRQDDRNFVRGDGAEILPERVVRGTSPKRSRSQEGDDGHEFESAHGGILSNVEVY